ncbi:SEFIR domain-containing protein [Gracilimonas sp.]|uniref:SEFIR domain-containing protein n=1 Tax=Gracilimonas sp. TaxID=1974203 RepID=UPI0032EF71D0
MNKLNHLTVFIAYSHDDELHKKQALKLSNQLRTDGINCTIDQYVTDPIEGWPRWMINNIRNSDHVLLICTKKYYKKVFDDNAGKGAKWESQLIYGELYQKIEGTKKFKPIIFRDEDSQWIPEILDQKTHYQFPRDYEKLYRELTDQPIIKKPKLGSLKEFDDKQDKIEPKAAVSDGLPKNIDENDYQFFLELSSDFQPPDKKETVISNLLQIKNFPQTFYLADTNIRSLNHLWKELEKINSKSSQVFLLKDKKIYSFNDLRDTPWDKLCDPGTCDRIYTNNWLFGENSDNRNKLFELFYLALKEQLYTNYRIKYDAYLDLYYFNSIPNKDERIIKYNSLKGKDTPVTVVNKLKEKDGQKYLRHHAFETKFIKYIDKFFLEINPTYYFSIDGKKTDKFHEDKLKKIKEIDKHVAVRNQLLLWEDVLNRTVIKKEKDFFSFGNLNRYKTNKGIVDKIWRKTKPKSNIPSEQIDIFSP